MLARVTLFLFAFLALIIPARGQLPSESEDKGIVERESPGIDPAPAFKPKTVPEAVPQSRLADTFDEYVLWAASLSALLLLWLLADAYLRSLKLQKKFAMLFCSNFLARWSSDHIRPGLYRCEYRLRYWPWPWVTVVIFVDRQRYPEEDFSEIDFPSFRRDVYAEVQDIIDNDLACSIKPHKEVIVRGHEVLIEAHMRGGEVWEQQPAIGISLSPSERTVEQSCVN